MKRIALLGFVVLGLLLPVGLAATLAAQTPPEDGYESENKAKSVRPAKSRPTPLTQTKKKADQPVPKDDEEQGNDVIKADDVAKLKSMVGKEVTVVGKVVDAYQPKSKAIVILNFGKDRKTCFKAVVFSRNFDKWDGGDRTILGYGGKLVTIKGELKLYEDAPQIVMNIPSQIKADKGK